MALSPQLTNQAPEFACDLVVAGFCLDPLGDGEAHAERRIVGARRDGGGEHLAIAASGGRFRYAGAAEDDDGVGDIVLCKKLLRFCVVERQPDSAHVLAAQEVGILVGLAIARVLDNRRDSRRRIGILGAGLRMMLRQWLAPAARCQGLCHRCIGGLSRAIVVDRHQFVLGELSVWIKVYRPF